MDHSKRWISLSPLNAADIADIQSAGICDILLCEASFHPEFFDSQPELAGNALRWAHAAQGRALREIALVTIVTIPLLTSI